MNNRLSTRLINYFLLIVLAAIMIGIEFYFEMQSEHLNQTLCEINTNDNSISSGLETLRNKIVIMFAVLTIVVAIVMTMFIKNITLPLIKIAHSAEAINDGDLSQVIEIENNDEIGMVGKAINELTSNLQECASFSCSTAIQALDKTKKLNLKINEGSEITADEINEINAILNTLVEFADSFQLLHTEIKTND